MKSIDINNLSYDETILLDRLQNIEHSAIASTAYDLLDEGHRIFVDDIFLIVVQDVFRLLKIESLDQKSYNRMLWLPEQGSFCTYNDMDYLLYRVQRLGKSC